MNLFRRVFIHLSLSFVFSIAFLPTGIAQLVETELTTDNGISFAVTRALPDTRTALAIHFHPVITDEDLRLPSLHFLGLDMLMLGDNADRSSDDAAEALADLDADLSYTGFFDEARLTLEAPDENLVAAAAIVNGILARPLFDDKTFRRQARYQKNIHVITQKSTQGALDDLAADILMHRHPYRPLMRWMSAQSLNQITKADLWRWHARTIARDQVTIAAVSNADEERLRAAVDVTLRGLKPVPNEQQQQALEVPNDWRPFVGVDRPIVLHKPDAKRTLLALHTPFPDKRAGFQVEMEILNTIMGQSAQSRLFTAIRTELRAAYDFTSIPDEYDHSIQLLRLVGEVDPDLLGQAIRTVKQTYGRFRDQGLSEQEFDFVRALLLRFYQSRFGDNKKLATHLADQDRLGHLYGVSGNPFAVLHSIDRQELNGFYKAVLGPADDMVVLIISPKPDVLKGACVIREYSDWRSCL